MGKEWGKSGNRVGREWEESGERFRREIEEREYLQGRYWEIVGRERGERGERVEI